MSLRVTNPLLPKNFPSCHPESRTGNAGRGETVTGSSTPAPRQAGEEKDSFGINQKSCVPRRRSEIMSPIIISAAAPGSPPQNYAHAPRRPLTHSLLSAHLHGPRRVLVLLLLAFISQSTRRPNRRYFSAAFRQECANVKAVDLQRHIHPPENSTRSLALKLISKNYSRLNTRYPCIVLACQGRLRETRPALAYFKKRLQDEFGAVV